MRIAIYCVLILLMTLAAQGASLQRSASAVLINQGQGFIPATDRTIIKPGDRVMASAGERAEIVYGNATCKLTIQPGAVVTVPPCEKTALGPPAKLGGCNPDDPESCRLEPEHDYSHVLLTAAALAAFTGAIIWVTQGDDAPASP